MTIDKPVSAAYQTITEELIAREWQRVLGVEPGRTDNFFQKGGASLSAAKVVVRISRMFEVSVPLSAILSHPALQDLAEYVDGIRRDSAAGTVVHPARVAREEPLPISFHQQIRLLNEVWARRHAQQGPSMVVPLAIEIRGNVTEGGIERALSELIARHESLRMYVEFEPGLDAGQLRIAPTASAELETTVCAEVVVADRLDRLAREQAWMTGSRLDLARAPLWRTRLLSFGPDFHVLMFGIDHLVIDGASIDILIEDFCAALHGQLPPPDGKTLDYIDWVCWQKHQLSGAGRARLVSYWRTAFAGTNAFPELELPSPTDDVPDGRHSAVVRLDRSQTKVFMEVAGSGGTAFTQGLAAVTMAWTRVQCHKEAVVHTPTANRAHLEFERVVGWMAHSVPIRITIDSAVGVREALEMTRSAIRNALLHQELPLPEIVAEVEPELRGKGRAARPRLFFDLEVVDDISRSVRGGCLVRRLRLPAPETVAPAGVSFYASLSGGEFSCEIVANPREVHAGFVDSLARALAAVLDDLTAR